MALVGAATAAGAYSPGRGSRPPRRWWFWVGRGRFGAWRFAPFAAAGRYSVRPDPWPWTAHGGGGRGDGGGLRHGGHAPWILRPPRSGLAVVAAACVFLADRYARRWAARHRAEQQQKQQHEGDDGGPPTTHGFAPTTGGASLRLWHGCGFWTRARRPRQRIWRRSKPK